MKFCFGAFKVYNSPTWKSFDIRIKLKQIRSYSSAFTIDDAIILYTQICLYTVLTFFSTECFVSNDGGIK